MGAWGYCTDCNATLPLPNLADAVRGFIRCTKCGSCDRTLTDDERWNIADDFVKEHARLEGQVEELTRILASIAPQKNSRR